MSTYQEQVTIKGESLGKCLSTETLVVDASTAAGLASIDVDAVYALITAVDVAANFHPLAATAPTTTLGHPLAVGATEAFGVNELADLSFISTDTSTTLFVTYHGKA